VLDGEQFLGMSLLLDRIQGRFAPFGDGNFVALTRQLPAQGRPGRVLTKLARQKCPRRAPWRWVWGWMPPPSSALMLPG
jgi:hypothetical protein